MTAFLTIFRRLPTTFRRFSKLVQRSHELCRTFSQTFRRYPKIAEDSKMVGSYTNECTVGKKMAAVHFTTIPCEPNTAYKAQGKPNFYNICPSTKDIVYRRFEDFITLLYLFMNVVKVLVR